MTIQQQIDEHLLRIFRRMSLMLVVVILVAGTVSGYHYYQQQSERATFRVLAGVFDTQIQLLHQLWLIRGEPLRIEQTEHTIFYSRSGWPERVDDGQNGDHFQARCQQLWRLLLDQPLQVGDSLIRVISSSSGCSYWLAPDSYLNYGFEQGLITRPY